MEMKYPIIIVISIILFIVCFFINFKKLKLKNNKKKIANTSIVKKTEKYKKIIRKYKVGIYIVYVLVFISLLFSSILTSRINETKTIEKKIYNRDIILCMDVSGSVLDLNAELVDSYRDIVKNLNGERFGISIFNTSSYLLVPLTDDYDYIDETLSTLKKAFKVGTGNYTGSDYFDLIRYIVNGTTVGNETRGSSLIGDGLASCVFDFPNLEEDRSRIIVFSTDNEVQGTEYVNVLEAGDISKDKNITVYTIAPKTSESRFTSDLETVSNKTGGKFYKEGSGETVTSIVNGIESKEKTLLEGSKRTVTTDYPETIFILTFLSIGLLIVIDKVVLS